MSLKFVIFSLVVWIAIPAFAQNKTIERSDLRILYVGQNPDTEEEYYYGGNPEVMAGHKKVRAADFMKLLNQYFINVTLVYGEDYKESMSDKHDVTIFDALIPKLTEAEFKMNEELGHKVRTKDATYLSDDFDAASILIAGVSAPMMVPKKLKINWACHCLQEHAFDLTEDHPVFNTPYKVEIVKEKVKTPGSFRRFYAGRNLGDSVQMVPMQTISYKDYAPGLVSYPGIEDSPDAEWISGGTNIKSSRSVAIGRHGNFFQWGFRASPTYMTETAKMAFINSIHYISKFNRQKPYVHRVSEDRDHKLDFAYLVSDKGFEIFTKGIEASNKMINSVRAKKMAGWELNEEEEYYLEEDYYPPDRLFYFRNLPRELIQKYGDQWNDYLAYYVDNYDYLYQVEPSVRGSVNFAIDPDAKTLGIPNNDIRLLETCVRMLKQKDRPEMAQRLLKRYTNETFDTAKQWKKWLKKNRSKLFFTDVGGYKFMVAR